jgi:hypothetical protein
MYKRLIDGHKNITKEPLNTGDCFIEVTIWEGLTIQWNLSNPTHQRTREMCRIVLDVRVLRFYLVNRNTLGQTF